MKMNFFEIIALLGTIASTILWIYHAFNGNITEMWLSCAFFWISAIVLRLEQLEKTK